MYATEITELWQRGRATWSNFAVSKEELAEYLAERMDTKRLAEADQELADDLYLACGCCLGLDPAIGAFEQRHGADIDRALGPMGLPGDLRQEVKQSVRTKLFVSSRDKAPQIRKYSGRGRLAGWVRAVAVRTAIDILRREKSDEVGVDESILEALAEADIDPDIRALKASYRQLANDAFVAAFASLSSRERNLLRQHYIHQLNIDKLGAMYGVHRATAFRWVAKARAAVFAEARRYVAQSIGEGSEEAADLLRLLESQIDVSLDRLLRSTSTD